MDTATIVAVCTTIVTVISLGVAFVQNQKAKTMGEAGIAYIEGLSAYEQGMEDKNLTDEELIRVGKFASKHYAAMKGVFVNA